MSDHADRPAQDPEAPAEPAVDAAGETDHPVPRRRRGRRPAAAVSEATPDLADETVTSTSTDDPGESEGENDDVVEAAGEETERGADPSIAPELSSLEGEVQSSTADAERSEADSVTDDEAVEEDKAAEEAAAPLSEADLRAQHVRLIEALIFASTTTLDRKALAGHLPKGTDIDSILQELAELYAGRGVNLVKVAGGYAFRTASDLANGLRIEKTVQRKLSRASVETLAIIAYHQPVTRAEIEQIRGVGLSKGTLDLLFEQNWIQPLGRRRAPGKPVTWGTTDFFLEHFGLSNREDLPGFEDLKAAGLLDQRADVQIYRPDEPDLPLTAEDDEPELPLMVDDEPKVAAEPNATGPEAPVAETTETDRPESTAAETAAEAPVEPSDPPVADPTDEPKAA